MPVISVGLLSVGLVLLSLPEPPSLYGHFKSRVYYGYIGPFLKMFLRVEMKLTIALAVLIGILVLACSSNALAAIEPTANIDATVEARVAQERAVDATVETRLKEERASQPTSIPSPTNIQALKPTNTASPQPFDTPKPESTNTPTPTPTPSPTPIPTATTTPTPSAVSVTKWGTEGLGDGQFSDPYGVAVAPDGSVCVADHDNHRIQKFTSAGVFATKWGKARETGSSTSRMASQWRLTVASTLRTLSTTASRSSRWGRDGDAAASSWLPKKNPTAHPLTAINLFCLTLSSNCF